jgi:hypothetical protein
VTLVRASKIPPPNRRYRERPRCTCPARPLDVDKTTLNATSCHAKRPHPASVIWPATCGYPIRNDGTKRHLSYPDFVLLSIDLNRRRYATNAASPTVFPPKQHPVRSATHQGFFQVEHTQDFPRHWRTRFSISEMTSFQKRQHSTNRRPATPWLYRDSLGQRPPQLEIRYPAGIYSLATTGTPRHPPARRSPD